MLSYLCAGVYPVGQIMDYPAVNDSRTAKDRFTSEEKRALDRAENDVYNEVRLAAEAHRQVCLYIIYSIIFSLQHGMTIIFLNVSNF